MSQAEITRTTVTTIADLIAKSENCPDFRQFSAVFDTLGVQSWLTQTEKALHFGIGAFNPTGSDTVEIGTFEGASALFTMAGMRYRNKGTLHSIDPHLGAPPFLGAAPWQFTLQKFRKNVTAAGLMPYLRSILSDSQIASSIWPAKLIDSVLIDADHSYNGCLRDVECWATKLKPGGFMLIDDAEDPVLVELLQLIEDIKSLKGFAFEELVDGVAVFRRTNTDAFSLLDEIRNLPGLPRRRPWDMEYLQGLQPNSNYAPEKLASGNDLKTAYQLGYLARCEPGNYAVSINAPPSDVAMVDALIDARGDGVKVVVDPKKPLGSGYRMVVCGIDEVSSFKGRLLPGGVMIGRSALPASYENSIAERERLLDAGFEGCGWLDQIHWGFSRPHYLSMDAITEYIAGNMS